ncbi:p-loop containing nucleoside triphosphate hydrolase protein [Mycena sanguinolenta]|uniref:p-loop containing nucleoside triphosphate hydrolase protein n=1 Tax=Mycena sanguinolenta TaxID=230812 RepID=A0A8H6YEY0_9AGAR|nr:p-loop containing nucleoside triphosphate hydrolase protein [Mycena sanguinolenta]
MNPTSADDQFLAQTNGRHRAASASASLTCKNCKASLCANSDDIFADDKKNKIIITSSSSPANVERAVMNGSSTSTSHIISKVDSVPEDDGDGSYGHGKDDSAHIIHVQESVGLRKIGQLINLISGANLLVGHTIKSCTSAAQSTPPFQFDGRRVTLIDTPGLDDTTRSDTDILNRITLFLAKMYENGKKLTGVIYVHRISDVRMGGAATRNFRIFRLLCGEEALKNVVIATTMWDAVKHKKAVAREKELMNSEQFFKSALTKGARLLRHNNDVESAHAILRDLLGNTPHALCIQREIVDERKNILQTAVGRELNRELTEQIKQNQEDMTSLEKEMKDAIRSKDEETKKDLEIETRELRDKMHHVENDAQNFASNYHKLEAEMDEAVRDAQGIHRQIGELELRLEQLNVEKEKTEQKLAELRRKCGEGRGQAKPWSIAMMNMLS